MLTLSVITREVSSSDPLVPFEAKPL